MITKDLVSSFIKKEDLNVQGLSVHAYNFDGLESVYFMWGRNVIFEVDNNPEYERIQVYVNTRWGQVDIINGILKALGSPMRVYPLNDGSKDFGLFPKSMPIKHRTWRKATNFGWLFHATLKDLRLPSKFI